MAGLHWYLLIKLCRALAFVGLSGVAEWLGNVSGLKSRLIALLGDHTLDA